MFISGYFSKNLSKNNNKVLELTITYMLAQVILTFIKVAFCGHPFSLLYLFTPQFSMWYLFALLVLRAFLPVLVRVKFIIPIAFLVSVFIMDFDSVEMRDIVRLFSFAFFYILGYFVTGKHIKIIRHMKKFFPVALIVIGVCSLNIAHLLDNVTLRQFKFVFLRVQDLDGLGYGNMGFLIYAYSILLAVAIGIGIIALFPAKKCLFSVLGRNTLTAYIAQAAAYVIFVEVIGRFTFIPVTYMYIIAVAITAVWIPLTGNSIVAGWFSRFIKWSSAKLEKA